MFTSDFCSKMLELARLWEVVAIVAICRDIYIARITEFLNMMYTWYEENAFARSQTLLFTVLTEIVHSINTYVPTKQTTFNRGPSRMCTYTSGRKTSLRVQPNAKAKPETSRVLPLFSMSDRFIFSFCTQRLLCGCSRSLRLYVNR